MATVPFVKDTADFEERCSSDVLMLADFTASWCGPCKALSPIIDELAGEYSEEDLSIVKIDVDDNPELAQRFGIQGVPTLVLLEEGEELARFGGAPKSELRRRIDELL